jgi:hypothetical protein
VKPALRAEEVAQARFTSGLAGPGRTSGPPAGLWACAFWISVAAATMQACLLFCRSPGELFLSRAATGLLATANADDYIYTKCPSRLRLHQVPSFLRVLHPRRAPTRYAHPLSSSLLFLLCETEHTNPNFSYLAVYIRI